MALTRITKGVIKPNENYDTHNINSTGIVTAIGLDVNGNGDISGNLSVGGVLTYEDVTSIDSVGIITARNGIDCNGDIDVDGHTNLDNVSVSGVSTFHGINNISGEVNIGDSATGSSSNRLRIGASADIQLYHDSTASINYLTAQNGHLRIQNDNLRISALNNTKPFINADVNSAVKIYHAGNEKFRTTNTGAVVTGILTATDLDVDGHTNLDNVSVAGVTTFTGAIDANGDLDVDGHTNLDNVSVSGVSTLTGNVDFGGGIDVTGNITATGNFVANGTMNVGSYAVFGAVVGSDPGSNYYGTTNRFGGGVSISGALNIDGDIGHIGDTNTRIRFPADDTFSVETAGSERLRITSNGIVNIGDVVNNEYLGSTLKVRKDQNAVTRVTLRNENQGSGSAAAVQIGAYGNSWMLQCGSAANDSNAFTIRVDGTSNSNTGTERLRIATDGGVGINTDKTRNTKNVSIAGVTRDYTNSGTDLVDSGGIILQPTISLPSTGQSYPGIFWSGNTAALGRARAGILGVAASNHEATDLVFLTKNIGGGHGLYPSDERLRIKSNGRVGIATDNPKRALHVNDTVGGGIAVNGTTSGIQFGTVSMAGASYNAILSRAGSNDDHITGSTPGDLCLAPENNGAFILGLSPHLGAMTTGLRIDRLRNYDIYFNSRIKINTGSPASPSEKLRIESNGAVTLPDGTQGLRFGSAASQDFALYHSGSNSHIDHFGTGNLFLDFNNDFNLRFYRTSPTDVREALTVTNGVAANPEFTIKSNPTSASVNSGTHAPLVKFKGAGWNTSSGSVEVGTQLQSEHYYWTGSYSNTFGQTYPDFKIKMKNSDSASYVEKFAFSGDGVMRLQSGGGINFHNYGGGSGVTSNTLDDFEEGTFTCTLSGSSGGAITAARACYTKVGNMVMCEATFVNPGNNSVSGNWTMSLPFQFIGGGTGAYGGGKVTYTRYVPALTGGFQSYTIFTYYGQGVCYLYKLGTNGSSESQWMGGSVNNSLLFSFTMTYTTSS